MSDDTLSISSGEARLTLRRLRDADAGPIRDALQDWEVVRNLARVPWPYGIDDARSFIAKTRARWIAGCEYAFAIDDGALVGMIGLHDLRAGGAEIGYWLAKRQWGRGYATAAVRTMLEFGFTTLGLDVITAGVVTGNPGSMRVLEKAGFVPAGSMTCATLARGDLPALGYRITRPRWQAASAGGVRENQGRVTP